MPSRPSESGPAEAGGLLPDALVMTSFEVIGRLGVVATRHGLSLTQVRLLAILRDREPTMSELARHLGLDKSTISGLIDRAVARGLVRRAVDSEDARTVRVAMTDSGRAFVAPVQADAAAELAPLLERLPGPEQQSLARLLRRLLGPAESPDRKA